MSHQSETGKVWFVGAGPGDPELLTTKGRGRSLSMGLNGWKGCVREYLRSSQEHSLRDVARYFDSPAGDIISAISEAADDETVGGYCAARVQQDAGKVIEAAKGWGRLRAVVRSEAGAVSELLLHANDFRMRRDGLNIENEHFHLHVNWPRIEQTWLIRRGDSLCGVHFTDKQNESIFNLSLLRENGDFKQATLQAFEQDWQALTTMKELEKASNE